MHIRKLTEGDIKALKHRKQRIRDLQEEGICFGCHNFLHGDIFPDEGLIFYEDERIRCQFEKFPRVLGQTIIVTREHYEDMLEMPLDLGTYILQASQAIIQLHKDILGAEKVYMCTLCDGKRNHLHFQLFPRLPGDPVGYQNFVQPEGMIVDYRDAAEMYRQWMKDLLG